jgi:hypothetical protein
METKIITEPQSAENVMDIGIFDPKTLEFYINPKGFIALKNGDQDCRRVKLSRVLPFADPFKYIAVSDMSDKEIGIIRDLSDLPEEQQALIKKELESRYYCPVISEIVAIKEKMGYYYFDIKINDFKKVFAVKDVSRSIKQINDQCIIITDVDGNRYLIPDIWVIDVKSRRKIEPYMY